MMPLYHHIRERCQKIDSKEKEEVEDVKISAIASNENMLELKKKKLFPVTFSSRMKIKTNCR
jgi:hypothetical protein